MTKKFFIQSNGKKLAGVRNFVKAKSKYTAIILPGYKSVKEKKTYEDIKNLCVDLNINSIRIDTYGHGESAGSLDCINFEKVVNNLKDVVEYLKSSKDISSEELVIIANSFAADPSLEFCAIYGKIDNLILISPGLGTKLAKTKKNSRRENFYDKIIDFTGIKYSDFVYHLKRLKTNVHIFHGTADKRVPYSQSLELCEYIPICKLYPAEGFGHKPTSRKQIKYRLKVLQNILKLL